MTVPDWDLLGQPAPKREFDPRVRAGRDVGLPRRCVLNGHPAPGILLSHPPEPSGLLNFPIRYQLEVNEMARFVLYGITCQDSLESGKDEAYMQARIDDDSRWHDIWSADMNTGDVHAIVWASNYTSRVRIRLWEHDWVARPAGNIAPGDDELGHFELTVPPNDTGIVEITLTAHHGASSSVYKISYEVLRTPGEAAPGDWIVFNRLHCNDAKGKRDSVYLSMNNSPFWGPVRMRTGDDRTINRTVHISGQCTLQLWEKDTTGNNDSLGTATIVAGSYGDANSDDEYSVQFRWRGSSDVQDSVYTLYFTQGEEPEID